MASKNRRAGVITVQMNGQVLDAVGSFSYNLGHAKREALVGPDRVHGFSEKPQAPYIEGEIRDAGDFSLTDLLDATDVTVTLKLANSKTVLLRDGWYAADGKADTDEGKVEVRFEGMSAEEI